MILFIAKEAFTSSEMIESFETYPSNIEIVLCRFLCAIFLHISLADELSQALSFMKYALNHPWKFRSWFMAFIIGFAQFSAVILVEAVNLAVLLTNNTILDIIMNFLAIVIISELDDYFFLTVRNEPISKLISNGRIDDESWGQKKKGERQIELDVILRIQTTSSSHAAKEVEGNKLVKLDQTNQRPSKYRQQVVPSRSGIARTDTDDFFRNDTVQLDAEV